MPTLNAQQFPMLYVHDAQGAIDYKNAMTDAGSADTTSSAVRPVKNTRVHRKGDPHDAGD